MQNRTQNRHLLEKTPTRGCREMRTIPYVYAGVYEDGAASSGQAGSEVVVWSGALIEAVKAHSCVVLGLWCSRSRVAVSNYSCVRSCQGSHSAARSSSVALQLTF